MEEYPFFQLHCATPGHPPPVLRPTYACHTHHSYVISTWHHCEAPFVYVLFYPLPTRPPTSFPFSDKYLFRVLPLTSLYPLASIYPHPPSYHFPFAHLFLLFFFFFSGTSIRFSCVTGQALGRRTTPSPSGRHRCRQRREPHSVLPSPLLPASLVYLFSSFSFF